MEPEEIRLVKLAVPTKEQLSAKPIAEYSEAEKMIAGLPYVDNGPEILNGKAFAKVMCEKYNLSDPRDRIEREEILKSLLGTYSKNVMIEGPFYCKFGSNLHLEEGAYANFGCIFLDCAEIRVGKDSCFGPGCHVYTAGHPIDPAERKVFEFAKPIIIGKDCWIGGNSVICPGVTIGDGSTVGAGSVVTKDVEPYTLVVGVPARVIKRLQKPEEKNS